MRWRTRNASRDGRDLLDRLHVDAPHITEMRRTLQGLARHHHAEPGSHRTYLITSATRGEGKSTISGLASIVAAKMFRKRTLLIDADFRRPSIHKLFGLSPAPGLFEVLRGRMPLDRAVRATPIPTLRVLTVGEPTGPLGEAYVDDAFKDVIALARADYDLVFVDSAPAVAVVEPMMIAEHVDHVIIVVMAGETQLPIIRRFRQVVSSVQGKIAGVILNNATMGLPYYYDYRYYGYRPERPQRIRHIRRDPASGRPDARVSPRTTQGNHK